MHAADCGLPDNLCRLTAVSCGGREMFNPMDHPFIFLVVSLSAFWFSGWLGALCRARHGKMSEELRDYFAIILAAALTLVGLIVAFTFSMAVSR